MIVAPSSALAIVEAIRDDPDALALLQSLIDPMPEQESPLAYTVRGLAQRTGRSPKAIRGAIRRGELLAKLDGSSTCAPPRSSDRAASHSATLISMLAYAGLRPGEALGLRWGDVRDGTVLVQRAISLGQEADTKTRQHRTVRLLAPLRSDLVEWRLAAGRPPDDALVFPADDGSPWSEAAYQSWRRRSFARALTAVGVKAARPYDLRHSFASLLLHEGRSVIYVARQLGHDARLTLTRYGHVIEELEDQPRLAAEDAIRAARESLRTRLGPAAQTAAM